MSELQQVAAPMSRKAIRGWTELVRRLSLSGGFDEPWFDIVAFVEKQLPKLDEDFSFMIDDQLPYEVHACTEVRDRTIAMRPDVYDRAVRGEGRDRMTLAHELGHFLLHTELRLGRRLADSPVEPFRDPEWQAKCFGGELLISFRHYPKDTSPEEVARLFGVSVDAVRIQVKSWTREGLL